MSRGEALREELKMAAWRGRRARCAVLSSQKAVSIGGLPQDRRSALGNHLETNRFSPQEARPMDPSVEEELTLDPGLSSRAARCRKAGAKFAG